MTHSGDDDFEHYRPRQDLSDRHATAPVQGRSPHPGAQSGRRARHARKRNPLVTITFYVLLAVIAVLISGFTFLLIAAPTDFIRDKIIAVVKDETGRDLRVAGKTSFSIFPSLGIELRDVSLSPPPGMAGAPTVRMDALTISVPIVPLLQRELAIDKLVLHKPVFSLHVDSRGRKNWDFTKPGSRADRGRAGRIRLSQVSQPAGSKTLPAELRAFARGSGRQPEAKTGLAGLASLALDDVRIVSGTLHYSDARSGRRETVEQINVKLALESLTSPLSASGDLNWKSETVHFDGSVGSLKAVLDGITTKLAIKVDASTIIANFNGELTVHDSTVVEGNIRVRAASVRKLATWLGTDLPDAKGFGPLSLDGRLKTGASTVALRQATIVLDGATAKGKVLVETRGIRPFVRTTLQITELDLNKYMRAGGPAARRPGKPPAMPGKSTRRPKSIEELLERKPPQVRGYTKRAGKWSTEPIDVSGLGALDLEGRLTLDRLLYEKVKVGRSEIAIVLRNRQLKINFEDVRLYQGKGRGVLTLDATQAVPSFVARLSADGVAARPLLKDAVDFDRIAGNGRLTLNLTARGRNQKLIVSALNGTADFAFFNGALIGVNIAAIIRSAQRLNFSGWSDSPSQKTDFSELTATFNIVQGIARNQNLKMASPLLRVTGEGIVTLPAKTLDYVLKPTLVATLSGQGGQQGLEGIEVPIRVHGPWANPKFTPDFSAILKDPEAAIKKFTKGIKDSDVRRALDSLLGRSGKGARGNSDEDDAEKLLKKFLGR